jgi:hypothetical protein
MGAKDWNGNLKPGFVFVHGMWVKDGAVKGAEDDRKSPEHDAVTNPKHYQLLPGVEVKDVRKAILDAIDNPPSLHAVDCWSRSWEYLTRGWQKNELEDFKKAQVYLGWLIEELEKVEIREVEDATRKFAREWNEQLKAEEFRRKWFEMEQD